MNKHTHLRLSNESPVIAKGHNAVAECKKCDKHFSYSTQQENIIWECPYCKTYAKIPNKNMKNGGELNYSKEDILKMSYKDIFDLKAKYVKKTFLNKKQLLALPTKHILKNKQVLDASDIRKHQVKAFDFIQKKFPNKKVLFVLDPVFIYDYLNTMGYGQYGGAHYKDKVIKNPDESTLNKVTYWIFKDVVILKMGH